MRTELLRPVHLSGIHAYAEKSVFAGDLVNFRVSSDADYRLAVFRLGQDPDSSRQDVRISPELSAPARQQAIYPGSYVEVVRPLDAATPLEALTIECWIRPWDLKNWQGLVTQHSYPDSCGVGLFLLRTGEAGFYTGDGGAYDSAAGLVTPSPLGQERVWFHLVGVWDGSRKAIWVDGVQVVSEAFGGAVFPGPAPLRLAAYGDLAEGLPSTMKLFEGDLAMPAIYGRALSDEEIRQRASQLPPVAPSPSGLLAAWPLDEESGRRVKDIGPLAREGRIINRGTWMVGGPGFDAQSIPLYTDYHPQRDVRRGHALRFASDDLYDCGWLVSHSVRIPEDSRPGLYVGRISLEGGSTEPTVYDVTFVVKRAPSRPAAKMVVLCATSTWLAYNSTPFAKNTAGIDDRVWTPGGQQSVHDEAPQYSLYRFHSAGQSTFKMGTEMPWPVAAPHVRYDGGDGTVPFGYGHLTRADRYLHLWLEAEGFDYDVVTDLDLDRCPELLGSYRVLVINGHSEYWTARSYQGVDRFLNQGGKALVLSGNTMVWRVSFDTAGTEMECRKFGMGIGEQTEWPGELWHSQDGERGGLMRTCGMPAHELLGLEPAGFSRRDERDFRPFTVVDDSHPVFRGTGLRNGDSFGLAFDPGADIASGTAQPDGALPRAVGHEWDVRLGELSISDPPPQGAIAPVERPGITTLAETLSGDRQGVLLVPWFGNLTFEASQDSVISQVIVWDRPGGGSLFYAGSVACGWSLQEDEVFGQMIRNVLEDFGIEKAPLRFKEVTVGIYQDVLFILAREGRTKNILAKRRVGSSWDPPSHWEPLGGHMAHPPFALDVAGHRLNAITVGEDGTFNNRWWTGSWNPGGTAWQEVDSGLLGRPAGVVRPTDLIDVFAVDAFGSMWHRFWDGSVLLPAEDLGGNLAGPCAAVIRGSSLNVLALGLTGEVLSSWRVNGEWLPWESLGGNFFSPFAAVSVQASEVHLLGISADRTMVHKYWNGSEWVPGPEPSADWMSLGGAFAGPMTAISSASTVLAYGIGLDGVLHEQEWDGTAWNAQWRSLGGVGLVHISAVTGSGGRRDLLAVDESGELFHKRWDGMSWSPSVMGWDLVE